MKSFANDDELRVVLRAESERLGVTLDRLLDPRFLAENLEASEVLQDALYFALDQADERDPHAARQRDLVEGWKLMIEQDD